MRKGLLKKFDTFIFDWDGTLTKMKFYMAVYHDFDIIMKYRRTQSLKGASKKPDFDSMAYLKKYEHRLSIEKNALSYLANIPMLVVRPRLQEGAAAVLERLRSEKKNIALVTNALPFRAAREIARLGIEEYFDVIFSTRTTHAIKPNPLGINAVLHALKANRQKTIYMGDMVDDVVAAKLAKVHSCAIANGFDTKEVLMESDPEYVFNNMEEFRKAL